MTEINAETFSAANGTGAMEFRREALAKFHAQLWQQTWAIYETFGISSITDYSAGTVRYNQSASTATMRTPVFSNHGWPATTWTGSCGAPLADFTYSWQHVHFENSTVIDSHMLGAVRMGVLA